MKTYIIKDTFCLFVAPKFNAGKANLLMMIREKDPPLNLAMLASWIRTKGSKTAILDCDIDAHNYSIFKRKINYFRKKYPLEKFYIGFYVCTPTAYECYHLAKIVKDCIPESILIAGGPHATFLPEEVLNSSPMDIVVIGEGEITLEEILLQRDLNDVNGIAFLNPKNKKEIIKTKPRERFTNLDILPIPAYDLLNIKKYRSPIGAFKRLPSFLVSFSRGCPNYCFFCTKTLGTSFFQKSAVKMFEEIKYLKVNFGIIDFVIVDDTFTADRENVLRFCNILLQTNMNITWHCYTRANNIDTELLVEMKRAGCHQLMFGIESFDDDVLEKVNKGINSSIAIEAIQKTQATGISCRLSMMVGNIGDTPKTLNHSIDEIIRLKPDFINILIATPGPGTPFFSWADKNGRIITKDWDKYTGGTAVVKLDDISINEINKYYKRFWIKFYFHPRIILRHLLKITNRYQLKNFLVAITRILKFLIYRH